MSSPGLPHHRRGPRVDERRYDPEERAAERAGLAVGFVLALLIVISLVAGIA